MFSRWTMGIWTPERVQKLRDLHRNGLSYGLIGQELGVSRNACIGKAYRIGLERRAERSMPKHHKPQTGGTNGGRRKGGQKKHPSPPSVIADFEPIEDSAIPQRQRKALTDLTDAFCRWPVGEPGQPDFFFCGAETANKPYCPHHARIAYAGYGRRFTDVPLFTQVAAE